MPTTVRKQTEPKPPADADTVLREVAKVLAKHGWVQTATSVDPEGTVTIAGKAQPADEPAT